MKYFINLFNLLLLFNFQWQVVDFPQLFQRFPLWSILLRSVIFSLIVIFSVFFVKMKMICFSHFIRKSRFKCYWLMRLCLLISSRFYTVFLLIFINLILDYNFLLWKQFSWKSSWMMTLKSCKSSIVNFLCFLRYL